MGIKTMTKLSHINDQGQAEMVDISGKDKTKRTALAFGEINMQKETLKMIIKGNSPKGDVLSTARLAGIMAAKKTSDLIPLCHQINLAKINVWFEINEKKNTIEIRSEAILDDKTGVEMEALTAVSVAALTLYDMCKAGDRGMKIENIHLTFKEGGKSGTYNSND